MSEKCFCHLNGFQVKDATARNQIVSLDQRIEGNEESIQDLYNKLNGGSLPPLTDDDNGKFVQVVNGVYALVTLQNVSAEGM